MAEDKQKVTYCWGYKYYIRIEFWMKKIKLDMNYRMKIMWSRKQKNVSHFRDKF